MASKRSTLKRPLPVRCLAGCRGDRWNSQGPGGVGNASYVRGTVLGGVGTGPRREGWHKGPVLLVLLMPRIHITAPCDRYHGDALASTLAACCFALQVWLPLLPRIGAPGFQLVWAEKWSVQLFKGAWWDANAQQVHFMPAATRGAAGDSPTAVS